VPARYLKKTLGEKSFTAFSYVTMTLYAMIVFLPLLYIIQLTLSTSTDISFRIFPKGFTFKHYAYVISEGLILRPLLNSVVLTAVCTVVSVTLTVLIAYPLSRRELLGRRAFNFLLILPMMVSLGFLPRYLLVWQLGLLNSYMAIVLTSAVSSFNTIIVRNYFSHISDSLVESARMDGCPEIRILAQIVMPIAKPAIATIALFYMVSVWNKYFDIILYINDTDKHTLQVILRSLVMDETQYRTVTDAMQQYTRNIQYTAIVIAIIPVMIVYPLLQRHFVKGIMLGSVKG
jgi:ABC-type glycerol-3-phosphate transport system permease component